MKTGKIKIAPSILSADFGNLNKEIKEIERAKADLIHLDVMDGHFVPNITIGPPVARHLKTRLPITVHLMIDNPEKYIEAFVKVNKKIKNIIIHFELSYNSRQSLLGLAGQIKGLGKNAGLAINPDTPFETFEPFVSHFDMILLMTVNPGFGGQKFMTKVLPKIKSLRRKDQHLDIAVDGGINIKTAKMAVKAGANILVAGEAIFGKKDRKKAIWALRRAVN